MFKNNRWQVIVILVAAVLLTMFARFIDEFEDGEKTETAILPDDEYVAADQVNMEFILKDFYVDGIHINNWELYGPFVKFNGRVYVCADETMRTCLGFELSYNEEQSMLLLKETESSGAGASCGGIGCHFEDRPVTTLRDLLVVETTDFSLFDNYSRFTASLEATDNARRAKYLERFPWMAHFGLKAESDDMHVIEERGTCFVYGDSYYISMDWLEEAFGWSMYSDDISGYYISTDRDFPAEDWYSENNHSFIEGKSAYMRSQNGALTEARSLYYEYIFRHEAKVYGLQETFLMGVCRGEGMFREKVIGGGAVGLMQIMPDTGRRQGYSYEDLLDPHKNIQFGAMYIYNISKNYGGDMILTMTAYNQGGGAVASGNYNTAYAERILGHKANIESWLASRGYSNTFHEDLNVEHQ